MQIKLKNLINEQNQKHINNYEFRKSILSHRIDTDRPELSKFTLIEIRESHPSIVD